MINHFIRKLRQKLSYKMIYDNYYLVTTLKSSPDFKLNVVFAAKFNSQSATIKLNSVRTKYFVSEDFLSWFTFVLCKTER